MISNATQHKRIRKWIRAHIPSGRLETAFVTGTRLARFLAGRELLSSRDIQPKYLTLGHAGARFSIVPDLLSPQSIVYCAGIGKDVSFDLALIQQFKLEVHAFDPTPRSLAWLKTQALPPSFHPHSYGFADYEGEAEFAEPPLECDDSYTIVRREGYDQSKAGDIRRLTSAMAELGHSAIDLLKLDIEGAEYGVIRDIVQTQLPVKQLCVEFHHRWREIGVHKTKEAIKSLRAAGFRVFYISPSGEEYGFLGPGSGYQRGPNLQPEVVQSSTMQTPPLV